MTTFSLLFSKFTSRNFLYNLLGNHRKYRKLVAMETNDSEETMDEEMMCCSSGPPPPTEEEEKNDLVHQFSCLGTTDKDVLIKQLQKIIGPSLNSYAAHFFLDMNNWNLQLAVGSYFDLTTTTTNNTDQQQHQDVWPLAADEMGPQNRDIELPNRDMGPQNCDMRGTGPQNREMGPLSACLPSAWPLSADMGPPSSAWPPPPSSSASPLSADEKIKGRTSAYSMRCEEDNNNISGSKNSKIAKSWRIGNDGLSTWPTGSHLRIINGNNFTCDRIDRISVPPLMAQESVIVTLHLELPPPPVDEQQTAQQQMNWQMCTPEGYLFGQLLTVNVNCFIDNVAQQLSGLST